MRAWCNSVRHGTELCIEYQLSSPRLSRELILPRGTVSPPERDGGVILVRSSADQDAASPGEVSLYAQLTNNQPRVRLLAVLVQW